MSKKYELTEETITINGRILHRIRALKDFSNVKKGDLGGFIEKEENLSHEGDCWVYDNAKVFMDAKVYEDAWVSREAKVYDNAKVFGDAWVFGIAKVYGDAWVYGKAKVFDDTEVFENAHVYGDAEVYGDAWVFENARVYGDAWVFENARVYGKARVFGDARVYEDAQVSENSRVFGKAKVFENARVYEIAFDDSHPTKSKKVSETPHQNVCAELTDLYNKKNGDYGDSFHKSFEEYGLTMIAIRLADKYNRISNLIKRDRLSITDETIRDTLLDLANYAIMAIMELDRERMNGYLPDDDER